MSCCTTLSCVVCVAFLSLRTVQVCVPSYEECFFCKCVVFHFSELCVFVPNIRAVQVFCYCVAFLSLAVCKYANGAVIRRVICAAGCPLHVVGSQQPS
jgi:hypothetical protein